MKFEDIDINKIREDIDNSNIYSLSKGVMGAVLCCYLSNDENFDIDWREQQLQRVIDNFWSVKSVNFESGLTGIGFGIQFLLEKGYIDGDPDDVLSEVDNCIFRKYSLGSIKQTHGYISILIYIYIRLKYGLKEEINRCVFIEFVKDLINKIYQDDQKDLFNESLPFSINFSLPCYLYITCLLYDIDIYRSRIVKIWNEIINKVITIHPYLDSNKLYMCVVANEIYKRSLISKWKDYHNNLVNNISIDRIISSEFGDQQIFVKNGLAGFSLLLLNFFSGNKQIVRHLKLVLEKIDNSSIWQEYNEEIYGLDGYMGVRLIRSILYKKINL